MLDTLRKEGEPARVMTPAANHAFVAELAEDPLAQRLFCLTSCSFFILGNAMFVGETADTERKLDAVVRYEKVIEVNNGLQRLSTPRWPFRHTATYVAS